MRAVAFAVLIALSALSTPAANSQTTDAPVTNCDTYAASDLDPQRKANGVPFDKLTPEGAEVDITDTWELRITPVKVYRKTMVRPRSGFSSPPIRVTPTRNICSAFYMSMATGAEERS